MHNIIIAQCTPKGSGAIALLRLSGNGVFELSERFSKLSSGKLLTEMTTHTIAHGVILNKDNIKIDDVLFLIMKAPKTFTGQDTLEITCHNNQIIIENIIETAIFYGARLAQNGEFTKRSYLHNKIDILQAEAIQELIAAQSEQQARAALSQLEGSLSSYIKNIEQKIYQILGFSQASFEFIEEEDIEFNEHIKKIINDIISDISFVKQYYNQQVRIKDGIRIALIGSVNAGKSSLFNKLLQKNRALVSNIPGTTRDTIEATLFSQGMLLTLIDTAGIRKTEDILEKEGINRSYHEAARADIILLIVNSSEQLHDAEKKIYEDIFLQYHEKIILVHTKIDLPQQHSLELHHNKKYVIEISEKIPATISLLEQKIIEKAQELFSEQTPFLISLRQFNLLLSIEQLIDRIKIHLDMRAYELIAADATSAIEILQEVTGKTISEEAMDQIFQNFCVGK